MLYRLAQIWHWPNKQVQILWLLVRQFPGDGVAWQKLAEQTLATRDTAQIWRVYSAWAQTASTNTQVQIERVVLGLLTSPQEPGLAGQAEELYRRQPSNPGCRLAQVLALFDAGALNYTIEPRLTLARGLVLASTGRREESEKYWLRFRSISCCRKRSP